MAEHDYESALKALDNGNMNGFTIPAIRHALETMARMQKVLDMSKIEDIITYHETAASQEKKDE